MGACKRQFTVCISILLCIVGTAMWVTVFSYRIRVTSLSVTFKLYAQEPALVVASIN